MKLYRYEIELITPSFCAGANQSRGEIRAPAVRGQLRWWFRALGGSAEDERTVFGGVADSAVASSLIVRIRNLRRGQPEWNPPSLNRNSPESYVWHFASVSGKAPRSPDANGPRWSRDAVTPPKSTFTLEILQTRVLASGHQERFDLARRCFLQLGALGLRATRGLGAFSCTDEPFRQGVLQDLQANGFRTEYREKNLQTVDLIAREIGSIVKKFRSNPSMKATKPSPLGSSACGRQTSAVYFRPVRAGENATPFHLVVFEAPHQRVLGKASRGPNVVGH